MDPANPASFRHRIERLSTGRTYHFIDQLPKSYDPATTLTLLCVHGFPDLWYGWRHQIGPWTRKGHRVVVPDMLGYGGTDKPEDPSEYSTKKLCNDLAALLDVLAVKKAVLIGHDWGAYTVGRFALWHPDRLLGLVMLSVPFVPPNANYIPVEEVAKRVPNLKYQVYFADPRSTRDLDNNLRGFLKTAFGTKNGFDVEKILKGMLKGEQPDIPTLITDAELEYYYSQLKQGLQGPLSYYRTARTRYDEEKAANLPTSVRPDLPVLFLGGTADPISNPAHIQRAHQFIPRLQDVALEGNGHWIMVQSKQVVTEIIVDWLDIVLRTPKALL